MNVADVVGETIWPRLRRDILFGLCVTLAAGLALGSGRFIARAASVEVHPPMPPEVCALLRPELVDRLVPGAAPPTAGEPFDGPGLRSRFCRAESSRSSGNAYGKLLVILVHVGRHDGQDPVARAHGIVFPPYAAPPDGYGPIELGSEASRAVSVATDGTVNATVRARVGSYVVAVDYQATPASTDTAVAAALAVAQEVLSQL